jgi:membrane-bound lytic murein transglycosylase D
VHRLILLAVAVLCFSVTAHAQDRESRDTWLSRAKGQEQQASQKPEARFYPLARPGFMPQAPLSVAGAQPPRTLYIPGVNTDDYASASPTTLTEDEILLRIGRIYSYQAELLSAESSGDTERKRDILDLALTELSTLAQQPDLVEQARFRDLYRTIVTAYEEENGPIDSQNTQYGDIFQIRADIFAEMDDVESTDELAEESRDVTPNLGPVETVVPMPVNRLVESSISYLLKTPEKHLFNWISRSHTYFPMIEQIFKEEGLPDEMKYLAMVESGLIPTAQSWASAGGMWQFIVATGRAYGLEVNEWVDERRDPEKATRAAARHLKDLYEQFGNDWHLAMAGYNCSPARIRRAINRAENRLGRKATFWDIYNDIPRETRGYVPMYIAAALMASNPDGFDLPPVKAGPAYEYEKARVPGQMSLEDIAKAAGTDVSTLRALNPELRRNMTPPSRNGYELRMPIGGFELFAANYSGFRDLNSDPVEVVQYGPQYTRPILADNHQPSARYTGSQTAPFVAARYEAPPAESSSRSNSGERVVYKVRRGDNLGKIANRYGVTVSQLKNWNNLRSTTIRPGQRLDIYGSDGASSSEPRDTRVVYKVRRGDNLTEIARKYGVSVANLRSWNNICGSRIQVGQRLTIHTNGGGSSVTTHKVRRGDNLTEIARRYGVSVSDIRKWNNLRSNKILVGQRLKIHS